jgi:hypothetical protein
LRGQSSRHKKIELVKPRTADLAHHEVYFATQDVDRLLDPRKPTRGPYSVGGPTIEKGDALADRALEETARTQQVDQRCDVSYAVEVMDDREARLDLLIVDQCQRH